MTQYLTLAVAIATAQLQLRPAILTVHLARGEREAVSFDLAVDSADNASVCLRNLPGEVFVERDFKLVPANHVELSSDVARVWVRLDSSRLPTGTHEGRLVVRSASQESQARLRVRVWPYYMPTEPTFEFEPYYPGIFWLAGGCEPKPENLARLEAHLHVLADLRATRNTWLFNAWDLVPYVRIARTGQPLAEAAAANPGTIGVSERPQLDFSALQPFLDLPRKYGLRSLSTYYGVDADSAVVETCRAVSGQTFAADSPEARSVLVYWFSELARFWHAHGYRPVYCKISDEIGPEFVDEYVRRAREVRAAGLKPYTTITSWLPFSPELLEKMNPLCDQWQVGVGYLRQFRALTGGGFAVRSCEKVLTGPWLPYTNGDAQETWSLEGVFPDRPEHAIMSPTLTVDGAPLTLIGGPWGNRTRGIWATWAGAVYLSLPDGSDPNTGEHRIVLRYSELVPKPGAGPLLRLDKSDWVLYYGGGSEPYKASYLANRAFPWNMALYGVNAYAHWCYMWYPETERIGWFDDKLRWISSPAFEGLRDGNEDLTLYFAALAKAKTAANRKALQTLTSDAGPLKPHTQVYAWPLNTLITTVSGENSYSAYHQARRVILQTLCE